MIPPLNPQQSLKRSCPGSAPRTEPPDGTYFLRAGLAIPSCSPAYQKIMPLHKNGGLLYIRRNTVMSEVQEKMWCHCVHNGCFRP